MNNRINWFLSKSKSSIDYISLLADILNLQANDASNFVTSGGLVSQWIDRSPSANHANATLTARPTLSGTEVQFNGSANALTLSSEINTNASSIYVVFKNLDTITANKMLYGSSTVSGEDFRFFGTTGSGIEKTNYLVSGGGALQSMYGGSVNYHVLGIRRSGSTITVSYNDRTLLVVSNTLGTTAQKIGYLCRGVGGFFFKGNVKAFVVCSGSLSDSNHNGIVSQLMSRYSIPLAADKILISFGDSITASDSWSGPLATNLGLYEANLGIPGTRLTALNSNSGIARFQSQIMTRPYSDRIAILYGTNDISGVVSDTVFAAALDTVLSTLISVGYNPRNICVGSTPYRTGNGNATELNAYRTQIVNLTSTYNTRYCDVLQAMRDGGGDTLMADAIHPNATGYALISSVFQTAFTGA